jgi:spore coat protein H
MDSFLTQVHNYYMYLSPTTNRFVFLPWDMDLSMGAFFLAGTYEQLQDLSINHPHVGENKLIERLFGWDEFSTLYRERLRTLNDDCFSPKGFTSKGLVEVQSLLKESIARDMKRASDELAARRPNGFGPGPGGFGPGPGGPGPGGFGGLGTFSAYSLDKFIAKRHASIQAQLDGKSKGTIPSMGMGFGPPHTPESKSVPPDPNLQR